MFTDEGNWAPKRAFETRAFSLNVPLYQYILLDFNYILKCPVLALYIKHVY
jgi:hypothetical protein